MNEQEMIIALSNRVSMLEKELQMLAVIESERERQRSQTIKRIHERISANVKAISSLEKSVSGILLKIALFTGALMVLAPLVSDYLKGIVNI